MLLQQRRRRRASQAQALIFEEVDLNFSHVLNWKHVGGLVVNGLGFARLVQAVFAGMHEGFCLA